jgi:hypothetical protein
MLDKGMDDLTIAEGCVARASDMLKKHTLQGDANDKARNGILSELGKAKNALARIRAAASTAKPS